VKILKAILVLLFVALFAGTALAADGESRKLVVDKSLHTLVLYDSDGSVEKRFPISCGAGGEYETKEGDFKIYSKSVNPRWWLNEWLEDNPEAEPYLPYTEDRSNPLGTRFMPFFGEYGIHGTNEPMLIGRHVSHGCVRMQITNNEELFGYVDLYTPVTIKTDPNIPWRVTESFSAWWGIHNILNLARRRRAQEGEN